MPGEPCDLGTVCPLWLSPRWRSLNRHSRSFRSGARRAANGSGPRGRTVGRRSSRPPSGLAGGMTDHPTVSIETTGPSHPPVAAGRPQSERGGAAAGPAPLDRRNCSVRRETGKEQMVKVRHDEGVANRIGPEPCVGAREGVGEASAGERTGQPLSRESYISRAPTALSSRKAKRTGASSRVPARPGVVADPGMCGRSLRGNREISRSADGPRGQSVRGGKARSRSRR